MSDGAWRSASTLVHRALQVRPGEERQTLLLAANAFCIAVAWFVLDVVVERQRSPLPPFVYGALVPVAVLACVVVYVVISRRSGRLAPSLVFGPVALFALGVGAPLAWVYPIDRASRVVVVLLVLLANSLIFILHIDSVARVIVALDERRAMRLLPLVAGGGVAGGGFGRFMVEPVYRAYDSTGAMALTAAFIVGSILITTLSRPRRELLAALDDEVAPAASSPSGYLTIVAVLVAASTFAFNAADAHRELLPQDAPAGLARSQSLAMWLLGMGLVVLANLFLLGRWLRRFGVPAALLAGPVVGVATSFPFLMSTATATSLAWVSDQAASLGMSFELAAICLLYFRVKEQSRLAAQVAIAALVGGAARVCGHGFVFAWRPEDPRTMWLVITASWIVSLIAAVAAARAFASTAADLGSAGEP